MNAKTLYTFIAALIITLNSRAQQTELFTGENLFADCKLNIPLTYTGADKEASEKAAVTYKDVKLVLLNKDKKKGKISYGYYYIYLYKTSKITVVYLYAAEDYESGKMQQPIMTQYKPEYDRYYRADCFDKVLADNPQLKENVNAK